MEEKDKIINVNVEDILPNRFQPRLAFDENELNELSNSILKYGVIQPIILRQIGDKYEIIAGERRYKATVLAGLKTIPAIIKNADDNTSAEIALLENLQRKDLTVIEEAQSFRKLLNKGFTQDEIASKLGVSQSSIANKIRLLYLPRKIQDALLFNKISERHARSLIPLNNREMQENLLDRIINEKLTVKQTEDEISRLLNKDKKEVEDDIPQEIRKYIDREDENYTINKEEEKKPIINIDNNDTGREEINPFQLQFKDNLRKIEEELENNEESYYDSIINRDLEKHSIKVEQESVNKKTDIPNVIAKVRDLIKDFDNNIITTKENDLTDKYQIIIEIKKEE